MQEKVQFTPPDIKIYEGKPPPTSWVTQNIVQYYQNQSESSFLTDVLTYVQTLQSEQLQQTRSKGMELKESFAPFPEGASGDDVSTISTFNAAQGYVKTQMEYGEKLINVLKQTNPQLAQKLNAMLGQLKQAGASFPYLTGPQLNNLSEIMEQLNGFAQNSQPSTQRAFFNTQLNMLQSMMTNNNENIKDLQQEIQALQGRLQSLSDLEATLQNIMTALKSNPPSTDQLQQLIQNLQTVANKFSQLNPTQQQALVSYFQTLNQFKNANGQNLSQMIAEALVQLKTTSFLQANPKATPQQVTASLQTFLQQSNLQRSPLAFMQSLGNSIGDLLEEEDFPGSSSSSGEKYAAISGDTVTANPKALAALAQNYAPDEGSLDVLEAATGALSQTTQGEVEENNQKIEGYQKTVTTLKNTQQSFGKAAAFGVGQSYAAGKPPGLGAAGPAAGFGAAPPAGGGGGVGAEQNLPNQFANVILNHYMPEQQAYLSALAELLYLNNMGAEFGNTLLNDMLDFGQAADNYNFPLNSAGSGSTDFVGSETKAQAELSNERNQTQMDINNVMNSLVDIKKQLAQISQELSKATTASQKKLLTGMQQSLQNLQQNLLTEYNPTTFPPTGSLVNLQQTLNSIQIGPPTGSGHTQGSYFGVYGAPLGNDQYPPPPTGWQSSLSTGEYAVINGDPNATPPGGLVYTAGLASTFQQNYADQSQNMQMVLQMQMTEIQQEWTVVSTAMQLLNQMYMTIAQGIYK